LKKYQEASFSVFASNLLDFKSEKNYEFFKNINLPKSVECGMGFQLPITD